ncbi:hypothetical protein V7166_03780 [Bacillus thuringiensis]
MIKIVILSLGKWAPSKNILAYIEGEGRITVENKHLNLKEHPTFKQTTFTSKDYVDWDFTWNNHTLITIFRAKEAKWSNDPKQRQITPPSKGSRDYYPYFIKHIH